MDSHYKLLSRLLTQVVWVLSELTVELENVADFNQEVLPHLLFVHGFYVKVDECILSHHIPIAS